ncbi:MAG: ABC transporter substrate-binding protein, partial [Pseudomonadota bacterium]|nr:ABC transporter substrate-binding protein [Pseudomonadota bacterium]
MPRPRRLSILALVGVALAVAGCGSEQSQSLNAAVIGTGEVMLGDPLLPPASEGQAVLRVNVAQGLVRFDAAGEVEPGLAERWNVSDDGLSYIFRLQSGEWPDGRRIMARDVVRSLTRMLRADRDGATRDALGAIDEVVAMTERVIEIKLTAPRPNLLQLLAQPEMALIREGVGSGPFTIDEPETADPGEEAEGGANPAAPIELTWRPAEIDGEPGERENVRLSAMPAAEGIKAFRAGTIDLLLGGTVDDLPLATRANLD